MNCVYGRIHQQHHCAHYKLSMIFPYFYRHIPHLPSSTVYNVYSISLLLFFFFLLSTFPLCPSASPDSCCAPQQCLSFPRVRLNPPCYTRDVTGVNFLVSSASQHSLSFPPAATASNQNVKEGSKVFPFHKSNWTWGSPSQAERHIMVRYRLSALFSFKPTSGVSGA
jgi:hypothetical protein